MSYVACNVQSVLPAVRLQSSCAQRQRVDRIRVGGRHEEGGHAWAAIVPAVSILHHHGVFCVKASRRARQGRRPFQCAAAEGGTATPVSITAPNCELQFGLVLKAVGSVEALGAWDLAAAPALQWSTGHNWAVDVQLPEGSIAFKLVITDNGTYTYWEAGPDRAFEVPGGQATEHLQVVCQFDNTKDMQVVKAAQASTEEAVHAEAESHADASPAVEEVSAAANPDEPELDFPTDDSTELMTATVDMSDLPETPSASEAADEGSPSEQEPPQASAELQPDAPEAPQDVTNEQVEGLAEAESEAGEEEAESQASAASSPPAPDTAPAEANGAVADDSPASPFGKVKVVGVSDGSILYSFEDEAEEEEEDASALAQHLLGRPGVNAS